MHHANHIRLFTLSLLSFLFCIPCIHAQKPVFRNLQTVDGILDPFINCIYKDSDGFIWLGTGSTVERFDGLHSLHYSFEKPNLEPANCKVNDIIETVSYEYWIANVQGLWRLNHETREPERMFPDRIDFPVQALAKNKDNTLYIGTPNGLYIYQNGTLSHSMVEKNTVAVRNQILDICVDDSDIVWLLTYDGVALFEPKLREIRFFENPFASLSGQLTCMTLLEDRLYIGSRNNGIYTFDVTDRVFTHFFNCWSVEITHLSTDGYENLYVGTYGEGIAFLNTATSGIFFSATYLPFGQGGLASNFISSILVDDNIWVGSKFYTGVDFMRLPEDRLQYYAEKDFTTRGVSILSFYKTDTEILLGTREGFYYIADHLAEPAYFNRYNEAGKNLRSNIIYSFYKYGDAFLVGTCGGGLSVFDPVNLSIKDFEQSGKLLQNDIFMVQKDQKGRLWIPCSDGIYMYEPETETIKEYNNLNSGLPGNVVYSMLIDSQNRYWVTTIKGMCMYSPDEENFVTDIFPDDFITSEVVRSIYEDEEGNLLFCLLDGRLFFSDSSLTRYHYVIEDDKLFTANVIRDREGVYWIGTSSGVIKADTELSNFIYFASGDGFPDPCVNPTSRPYIDPTGHVWFATFDGLISLHPRITKSQSPLVFTQVDVNGESLLYNYSPEVSNHQTIKLKHTQRNLNIRFSSLQYREAEYLRYEYKLNGIDESWKTLNRRDEVSYYDLPPGKYTFSVREYLNDETTNTLSFIIKRRFPIWLLEILVVAGLLIIILYLYRKIYFKAKTSAEEDTEISSVKSKYRNTKMTPEEANQIYEKVNSYMITEKPYLNPELKLSALASATGLSSPIISQAFNIHLNTGYYEYINKFRVEEFKKLVKNPAYSKYTIISLANQSGFNSQTSFFRSFKKLTGVTPNEYIQKLPKKQGHPEI